MNYFQIDPNIHNKQDLWEIGKQINIAFLKLNNIKIPEIEIKNDLKLGKRKILNGMYDSSNKTVYINLKRSRPATKNPGYSWSFPGYKSDMTPIGILSHEIGHHIHYEKMNRQLNEKWFYEVLLKEPSITRYDNPKYYTSSIRALYESIAEAFKLFITNPNLLKVGRPLRYNFIINEFNVQPLHDIPWQDILLHAHPKFIKAAHSWIN